MNDGIGGGVGGPAQTGGESRSTARAALLIWAVGLAALVGWLVYELWPRLGLPARGASLDAPFPGLWRWFFAVWLPALFPAFTLVHALLLPADCAAAGRARRWDRWSYGLLPIFLLSMLAWAPGGAWRVQAGLFYMGVLFAKAALAVGTGYACFADPGPGPGREACPRLSTFLFVVPLVVYVFVGGYVVTSLSTAGDEHVYLLNTHSLYVDGDVDVRNNIERRDYATFYWGRPSPRVWNVSFVGFPAFLLPGYALGSRLLPSYPLAGRLGATLTIAGCAALLAIQTYRLCRDLGVSRFGAFWAWLVVAFTPPVLINSAHVYPEMPAAAAAVIGTRAVLRVRERAGRGLGTVAGAAAVLILLKDRYTPISLGLALWAIVCTARSRRRLAGLLLLGVFTAGGLMLAFNPLPRTFRNLGSLAQLGETWLAWNRWMPVASLGLVADQEVGLLYYAPHWALALPGLALLWARDRRAALGLGALVCFYLLAVVKYRWMQWDAGWTPPPRFLLSVAPLLAPCLGEVIDRCRGVPLAAANTLWLVWSAALGFCVSVMPFWRYNNLDGRSTVLEMAGQLLGFDLARFLPSLRAPTAWTWAVLAAGAIVLLAATWRCAARPRAERDDRASGGVLLAPGPALALVGGLAAVWVALAALVPTWSVEAAAMRHSGGIHFGSYQYQEIVWVMTRDGELSEPIVTWPGTTEVTIVAGAYTTTGTRPRMALLLDDREIGRWTLDAGDGNWVRREYRTRVATGFGHPVLRLRFADLADQRASRQVQHAYVGRIRLRWTPAGPDDRP